jgi:hypothetical protein
MIISLCVFSATNFCNPALVVAEPSAKYTLVLRNFSISSMNMDLAQAGGPSRSCRSMDTALVRLLAVQEPEKEEDTSEILG